MRHAWVEEPKKIKENVKLFFKKEKWNRPTLDEVEFPQISQEE